MRVIFPLILFGGVVSGCSSIDPDKLGTTEDDLLTVSRLPDDLEKPPPPLDVALAVPASKTYLEMDQGSRLAEAEKMVRSCGGIRVLSGSEAARFVAEFDFAADTRSETKERRVYKDKKDKEGELKPFQRFTTTMNVTLRIVDKAQGRGLLSENSTGGAYQDVEGGAWGGRGSPDSIRLEQTALQNALRSMVPKIQSVFRLRGRIVRMKGRRQMAFINLGSAHGLRKGHKLIVVSEEQVEVAGRKHQDVQKLGTLEVVRVETNGSWCEADSDARKNMLIGHAVMSVPSGSDY